jgi:hypothetical protein
MFSCFYVKIFPVTENSLARCNVWLESQWWCEKLRIYFISMHHMVALDSFKLLKNIKNTKACKLEIQHSNCHCAGAQRH